MTSSETRRVFLEFFAARGHRVVPSSPLILPRDPTLLFANAGMNQFKDVFTGREQREYTRAASAQKCLRVSGKHNDLEMVGRTPRHHTFFEMLGNFSFGDYFKEEAITLAWELLTGVYGIEPERLWVTVFAGSDAAPPDEEALSIWRDRVGFPAQRILRLGENENFWRMGDTGPCGPCSEVHYDLGSDLRSVPGESNPATDERRFVEIWNLVFMQFDQPSPGKLCPLPAPSIDTGMGLERISAVLQGRRSNFDTDLFVPLIRAAADRAGLSPGASEEGDFSLRVIADHVRALVFLVADGVVPANDSRGYVLRRLVRRGIRHARKLGIEGAFLGDIIPVVVETMGRVYPELHAAHPAMLDVAAREEQRFGETLATGLTLLEQSLAQLPRVGGVVPVLAGEDLFKLYDTFGFPLDLARDVAEERGVRLDEAGFDEHMARQRARARDSWKAGHGVDAAGVYAGLARAHASRFEGYASTRLEGARVLALVSGEADVKRIEEGKDGEVVLDRTPFYAESGGQVGDTGLMLGSDFRARVLDTRRAGGSLVVHRVHLETGSLGLGDGVLCEVDESRREATRRNHTATHLVHAALREVVGMHVKQAGSLVAPDRLRFDFSHFAPVSASALVDIESLVNRKVLEDLEVVTAADVPLPEALERGAMALFGEKYGDRVRVVAIGDFSLELCGGTHCLRTGEVGLIKLTQERGVASGTRRIEALSGEGSLERFRAEHAIVRSIEDQLSVPRERLLEEIERREAHLREVERDLERQRLEFVRERLASKAAAPQVVSGVRLVVERVDGVAVRELRQLADGLRQKLGSGVVVLGRAEADKASLLVAVTADLRDRLPAGPLVGELAPIIGGKGGGRPDLAEAGGKEPSRLDEALGAVAAAVRRRMGSASR